eukprot:8396505-Lingulodinium_polyedra.AAC.1
MHPPGNLLFTHGRTPSGCAATWNNTIATQLFPAPRAPAQQECSPFQGRAVAQRAKETWHAC